MGDGCRGDALLVLLMTAHFRVFLLVPFWGVEGTAEMTGVCLPVCLSVCAACALHPGQANGRSRANERTTEKKCLAFK